MKSCLNCVHAKWKKTAGGKNHPSGDGTCGYKYVPRPIPACMYWLRGNEPSGGYINRREELKDHCPVFQRAP